MLNKMEERERSRFREMLAKKIKNKIKRGGGQMEGGREGEKVRDSRMEIAGLVLSKAK